MTDAGHSMRFAALFRREGACALAFALAYALNAPQVLAAGEPEGATMARTSKMAVADVRWMQKVARFGVLEVEAGRLAQAQATQDEVRSFGKTMVEHFGQVSDELHALADSKGVLLPDKPDRAHARLLRKLAAVPAARFDKLYMASAGTKDHIDLARLLEDGIAKLKDAELKEFAAKTLPMIKRHFEMARDIRMVAAPPPKP